MILDTSAQYGVLASLHGLSNAGRQPSQRELAEFVGLEPMFVSKLARALQRAGLLERRAHAADPRALQLSLTRRGVAVVTAARTIVVQVERQRLAVLGGTDSARSGALRKSLLTLLKDAAIPTPAAAPTTPRKMPGARRRTGRRAGPNLASRFTHG